MRKKRFFTPWLQPGEQKRQKIKGLQPLKGLNAKAIKTLRKIITGLSKGIPMGEAPV
jgi:hypothetical protein